jgi:AcrR family transcriptional regulator
MKRSFRQTERGASQRILEAAQTVLARDGFAALTARAIAAEAGTNLALLNYYFGSKEQLLLAIFDELDRQRLGRQREMYADRAEPLSTKWRRAIAYYRQDLSDGYVRVLQELTAYGYSNPVISSAVRDRMNEWRVLLEDVASSYLPALGIAVPSSMVASAVASLWYGMEVQHLAGLSEEEGGFFELLDTISDWLEQREREVQPRGDHARTTAV